MNWHLVCILILRAVIGQHFKLDDCRVWMRLHFWAARECGLAEHEPFWQWYADFLGHFIRIYERSAPQYVSDSQRWSADEANIQKYLDDGCHMLDVVGKGRKTTHHPPGFRWVWRVSFHPMESLVQLYFVKACSNQSAHDATPGAPVVFVLALQPKCVCCIMPLSGITHAMMFRNCA